MLTTLGIIQRSVDNWKKDILLEQKSQSAKKLQNETKDLFDCKKLPFTKSFKKI